MRWLFSALFVLIGAAAQAQAQTPAPVSAPAPQTVTRSLEKDFLKNLFRDQKAIWTSPFRLRGSDVRWLAPLTAGTATFIGTDLRTGDAIATHTNLLRPSRALSQAGAFYSVGGAAAAFYVAGRLAHNDRARETGLLAGEALINAAIVGGVIKEITQRARPDIGEERGQFWAGGSSFPSGHAIGIWSIATVVAQEYHDKRWVQVTAYSVAGAVSIARLTAQRHYLSDILVGSAIGYGIGRYVYRAHSQDAAASRAAGNSPARPRGWPMIGADYNRRAHAYGVTLAWIY